MFTEDSVEIDAPPRLVWDVFTDVERWPEWTASVTSLTGLDGPALAVGRRFAIKQPGMTKLVWQVTELIPGASWTWVQRSPARGSPPPITSARDLEAAPWCASSWISAARSAPWWAG